MKMPHLNSKETVQEMLKHLQMVQLLIKTKLNQCCKETLVLQCQKRVLAPNQLMLQIEVTQSRLKT
jgi:hypothetical protein